MSIAQGRVLGRAGLATVAVATALVAGFAPGDRSEPADTVAGTWPAQVCTPKVNQPVTVNSVCIPPG